MSSEESKKPRTRQRKKDVSEINTITPTTKTSRKYYISNEMLETRNIKSKVTREENKYKKEQRNAILSKAREKKKTDNSENLFESLFRSGSTSPRGRNKEGTPPQQNISKSRSASP